MEGTATLNNVPLNQKYSLSLNEAAIYTGIGVNTIRVLITRPECDFAIKVGVKKYVIRRKQFEEYLDKHDFLQEADKVEE